jgi:predicted enzyme related to lactoylglutathione lyase
MSAAVLGMARTVETSGMTSFHHAHLMSADLDGALRFYTRFFDAEVVADVALAGSRNALVRMGSGRLNIYDQAPNHRGPVNHLGINVTDLPAVVARLEAGGVAVPRGIKEAEEFRYAMVSGPDGVLLELFEFDRDRTPEPLRAYFELT